MKRFKKIIALMIVVTCIFSTSVTAFGATKSISSQRPELYDIETSAYTTQRQFFLYWSDVPGATGYQVYRSTSKSGTYHLIKSVKTPYYNDKSVKDGKLYYYKVRATKKSNGKTSYSKFSLPKGKRALPKLEYLDKVTFSGQKVTVTLPKYCSASGYRYYYRDGNDPWKLLRTTSKKTVTLNLPKEKLGYQIKVTPYTTVGGKRYAGGTSNTYGHIKLLDPSKLSLTNYNNYCKLFSARSESVIFKNESSAVKNFRKYTRKLSKDRFDVYAKSVENSKTASFQSPFVESVFREVLKRPEGYFYLAQFGLGNDAEGSLTEKQQTAIVKKLRDELPLNLSDAQLNDYIADAKVYFNALLDNEESAYPFALYELDCIDYPDQFKALYYEIGRVISRIDSKSSEYDKAKQIHDYICKNMDYGYPKGPFSAYYGFAVYDALITKMGVCSDYAEAYKALCTKAGLECVYVTGDANNGSGYGGHAWNIVKIDGNWYHVDCTWDDPTNKGGDYVRYTYFLVSDKTLSVNHRWDRRNVPVCSKDYL